MNQSHVEHLIESSFHVTHVVTHVIKNPSLFSILAYVGLDGIGLGNVLIKRVVEQLREEFHNMNTFVTLSPIPGFKKWLDRQMKSYEGKELLVQCRREQGGGCPNSFLTSGVFLKIFVYNHNRTIV